MREKELLLDFTGSVQADRAAQLETASKPIVSRAALAMNRDSDP